MVSKYILARLNQLNYFHNFPPFVMTDDNLQIEWDILRQSDIFSSFKRYLKSAVISNKNDIY